MTELTETDLVVGATFRAKNPRRVLGTGENNDRTIIWRGRETLQYDGPAVRNGSRYPTVRFDAFLKWADRRVDTRQ